MLVPQLNLKKLPSLPFVRGFFPNLKKGGAIVLILIKSVSSALQQSYPAQKS
ncbi:Uncharacterised protein [Porphyromonas crevioricanis]|uniref:Uncharacterized protein n=1 Tax=Porphyromonas crevioricanis TaxID=393921 RepID=A0A2X4PGD5_9PORP|nr:Uncharacterised protein [Porphyromonas crevioricanis]